MTLARMTVLAAVALAAGCFNPKFKDNIQCGANGECPPGTSCGADDHCHAGVADAPQEPEIDARADADLPDARPDAMPVGCQGDGDCQTPPDLCFTAGTCNTTTHECDFPAVDCSGSADECNNAACDPAQGCIKDPAPKNGIPCGNGKVCGAFGACGGFASTCDSSGDQTRDCTVSTCQAGTCTDTPTTETQACSRATEGATCGGTSVTNCGACTGSSQGGCALDGVETCTCTEMKCMSDSCQPVSSSCQQSGCAELASGDVCGATAGGCPSGTFKDKCCSSTHLCSLVCSTCQ
ncbi:MAG TPA: hypothetical protein VL463_06700 [Kofleriaceae bacterium]|jgi:hypothetical protein|nr:hypothetical protein [Kofleriaceae bacterium]